ncbi:hypothetical protein BH10BAC4_BH10BAC4_25070 [soil metagenome]
MEKQADTHLIEEAKNGDIEAFRNIVEQHEGKVAAVIKGIVGDIPASTDVGQEVFIKLFESLAKLKSESSLPVYITRLAINFSLNEIKNQKWNLRSTGFMKVENKSTEESLPDLKKRLFSEIQQLETDLQLVVILRMMEGYSIQETATLLNIPTGKVMSRLYNAQNRLKQVIRHDQEDINKKKLEDLYILSLDEKLNTADEEWFLKELKEHPDWVRSLATHKKVRELVRARSQATFGPNFITKLFYKIQNTGIVVDRQIFGMFKKFQLAALGVIVALLILNMMLSEDSSWKTVLGIDNAAPPIQADDASFDFFETF